VRDPRARAWNDTAVLATRSSTARRLLAILAMLALAGLTSACAASAPAAETDPLATASSSDLPGYADLDGLAPAAPVSDLTTVAVAELPPGAVDTLRRIAAGGPFPYEKDGATFQNRERLLPSHPTGWYHEYTVITPGSNDRGTRRIITGTTDERYYTDDHYDSFREVVSGDAS
jgi:ribonuclease T1